MRKRKNIGFIPVRGSSSVGTGVSSTGSSGISSSDGELSESSGGSFAIIAAGLEGALSTGFAFLSGLGVTNSFKAPAPSTIVEPDVPMAAWTVRVYELHSSRSSVSMISTDSGISLTEVMSLIVVLLLSDCFDILSTILVISIESENVILIFLLSITLTDFKLNSVLVSASTAWLIRGTEIKAILKKRKEKIRSITWVNKKNRYTKQEL